MKKWKRAIAFALAMVLCLSLCGCSELENMRAAHAFWQEDGTILWEGNVYRKLDDVPEYASVVISNFDVYVTEPDVPVLLSDLMGEPYSVSQDKVLLCSWDWDGRAYYCREDKYEEIQQSLENGFEIDTYYYEYYTVDDDDNYGYDYYYLSELETNTIRRILVSVMPLPYDDYSKYVAHEIYLSGCDASHQFSEEYLLDIWITEDGYYLLKDELVYTVPIEYYDIFEGIVKAYMEGMGYWEDTPPSLVV